jgi:hypothetical protein
MLHKDLEGQFCTVFKLLRVQKMVFAKKIADFE